MPSRIQRGLHKADTLERGLKSTTNGCGSPFRRFPLDRLCWKCRLTPSTIFPVARAARV
ncbi:protein of unknown function [Candidatus Methylomirabilis oxygeniifera]|uniref:Uncharacterized protein n=1 Tax=Methylomirabilis oxygeniifera TaxID=671143 RepID=D5MKR7_METO1|nr:protein of unknown function [Candidatus Methylomirabilis oxyfera]